MNRLWVRIGAGIALCLFFVFFLQFLAITLDRPSAGEPPHPPQESAEIKRRLVDFFALSAFAGLAGGGLVAATVTIPLRRISTAAGRIGRGELGARAPERGPRELAALSRSFNAMAAALARAEAERTALFADLSHELRTPLAALEANLQAAFDGVSSLDAAALASLLEQTRHLGRLVNDLRELSLSESGRLPLDCAPADLRLLVAECVEALAPLATERGVTLAVEGPGPGEGKGPEPVVVLADETRIRQVLFNLVANAIRHAREGGRVGLACRAAGGGAGPEGLVEVSDDGVGLSPPELAAVFDRFYRADPSRSRDSGGTGLGLAICKALIEGHGGWIKAMSPGPGRGSIFAFGLPLAPRQVKVK
jgi:signal transduction histidine kinase